jgi:hypothetical protein
MPHSNAKPGAGGLPGRASRKGTTVNYDHDTATPDPMTAEEREPSEQYELRASLARIERRLGIVDQAVRRLWWNTYGPHNTLPEPD